MKKATILITLASILFFASCENEIDVDVPTLKVTTEKREYSVNDTVHFIFSGHADYITFYAGNSGSAYRYRNRTQVENATPILKFHSHGRFGPPERNLSLLIATNFNGQMTEESINAANWQDISDRVDFSTGTMIPSGDIDLSDFADNPSVHFAFKYVGIGNTASAQKSWNIEQFSLTTYDDLGNIYPVIPTLIDADWSQLSIEGDSRVWSINETRLFLGANANEPSNLDWVISKGLNLALIAPDKGISIKTLTSTLEPFYHIYTEPGEYTVTFLAKNQNVYGEQEVIREFTLTITD